MPNLQKKRKCRECQKRSKQKRNRTDKFAVPLCKSLDAHWQFCPVSELRPESPRFNASCCNANGGYTPDGFVTAITLLHESGTGGGVKYGVVGQMPLTTLEGVNVLDNLTYMQPRKVKDKAEVGLYRTELGNVGSTVVSNWKVI